MTGAGTHAGHAITSPAALIYHLTIVTRNHGNFVKTGVHVLNPFSVKQGRGLQIWEVKTVSRKKNVILCSLMVATLVVMLLILAGIRRGYWSSMQA
jgi:hypothetical protein